MHLFWDYFCAEIDRYLYCVNYYDHILIYSYCSIRTTTQCFIIDKTNQFHLGKFQFSHYYLYQKWDVMTIILFAGELSVSCMQIGFRINYYLDTLYSFHPSYLLGSLNNKINLSIFWFIYWHWRKLIILPQRG